MVRQASPVSLEDRAAALRKNSGDTIPVEEITNVVESLVQGDSGLEMAAVVSELKDILAYVSAAQAELAAIRPKAMSSHDIPNASMELEAVVHATEQAAGTIMDVADQLGTMASAPDAAEHEKLSEFSTVLFEASSFQDLTGQRINKVATTLNHLEERLGALATAIGDASEAEEKAAFDSSGEVVDETALLSGPSDEGVGNSQAEIDALLASFD